jgi:hypothetical protein
MRKQVLIAPRPPHPFFYILTFVFFIPSFDKTEAQYLQFGYSNVMRLCMWFPHKSIVHLTPLALLCHLVDLFWPRIGYEPMLGGY